MTRRHRRPCGPCCEDPCAITSDAFDGDLAAYATVGSPAIFGSKLLMSAGDAVTHSAEAESADVPVRALITIDTEDDPAEVQLNIAESDGDNKLWGRARRDGSSLFLKVGKREGGTDEDYTAEVEIDLPTLPTTLCLEYRPGATQTPDFFTSSPHYPSQYDPAVGDWLNPDNIFDYDATTATHEPPSGAPDVGSPIAPVDYQIDLPPGSDVDDIRVVIVAQKQLLSGIGNINIHKVQLFDEVDTAYPDLGSGTIISGLTLTEYTFDGWSVLPTWENINLPTFGVEVQFEWEGSDGICELDTVAMAVDFYSPPRLPGFLRLSVNGYCVAEFSATAPTDGLKAGAEVLVGDFELDDFLYQYAKSAERPSCGECGDGECVDPPSGNEEPSTPEPCANCCAGTHPAAPAYSLNFGAGGWEENSSVPGCDTALCDTIAGVLILDSLSPCFWSWLNAITCSGIASVGLYLIDDGEGGCQWEAVATLWAALGCQECAEDLQPARRAIYRSASLASNEDCRTVPVTLTKVAEFGVSCEGNLPNTIELDIP